MASGFSRPAEKTSAFDAPLRCWRCPETSVPPPAVIVQTTDAELTASTESCLFPSLDCAYLSASAILRRERIDVCSPIE